MKRRRIQLSASTSIALFVETHIALVRILGSSGSLLVTGVAVEKLAQREFSEIASRRGPNVTRDAFEVFPNRAPSPTASQPK